MNINTKVQDEKIIIITEDQILKALNLPSYKYTLSDVEMVSTSNNKIIIHVKSRDSFNRSVKMNLCESKTLDEFVDDVPKLKDAKTLERVWANSWNFNSVED